jgi:hypothetical protein
MKKRETNCTNVDYKATKELAILLLADPTDTRSFEEKAKECGVTKVTLWRWRQDLDFLAKVNTKTTELVNAGRAEAMQCLVRCFRAGDRAAARDFLQVTNDIGSGTTVTTNVIQTNDSEYAKDLDTWQKNRGQKNRVQRKTNGSNGRTRNKVSG